MNYNWNWAVLFDQTGIGDEIYLDWMITGIGWLFALAGLAWVIAVVLGGVLGVLRTLPNKWVRLFAATYVEVFRNIPLLVQLFIWFFVVPEYLSEGFRIWWYQELDPNTSTFLSASIGLGLFTASRVCEQVRTGIEALPKGQAQAALAMGFTRAQTYRFVLLPQAVRIILPPLTGELTSCFKNASVASLLGAAELITQVKTASEYTQNNFELYTYATLIYLVINLSLTFVMTRIERKLTIPGQMGGVQT